MDLLIQFPTRKRKEKFLTYLSRYVETLSGANNVTININCDIDDDSMNNDMMKYKISEIFKQNSFIYPTANSKAILKFYKNNIKLINLIIDFLRILK